MEFDDLLHLFSCEQPTVNRREIQRYARAPELTAEQAAVMEECLAEMLPQLSYRCCWRYFPIAKSGELLDLGFAVVQSKALGLNLSGCKGIVLMAATIGLMTDRLIAKYGRISPVKALFIQAIGAERIEAFCDQFCEELKRQGHCLRPRFSPGYGDLPLSFQQDIFNVLECPKRIGLTLTDSMLMSPSKSVSAIVGISDKEE